MTAQMIHLSSKEIYLKYANLINSDLFQFDPGSFLLEIRDISDSYINDVKEFTGEEKKIFCKKSGSPALFNNGTISEINSIIKGFPLGEIRFESEKVLKNYEDYYSKSYSIGETEFDFRNSYVMGILNVTPDSFSDGGLYLNIDDAVNHAIEMINDRADIIDVGGESTRPGSDIVNEKDEMKRVIPVIDKILSAKPKTIISIDTTKSRVSEEAIKHGAKIINDISGATFDDQMLEIAKKYNVPIVLMHIKGMPKTMQQNPYYENLIEEVYDFLYERIKAAEVLGIDKIFVDPGIGFGKRIHDNFEILNRLEDFKSLGYPIMIGASRKSFLGKKLSLDIDERETATAIAESVAVKNGARIIRTHNVKFGRQVCEILNNF